MKWKDVTSYGRNERGVIEPSAWTLVNCAFTVMVHRWHACPGTWWLSVTELGLDRIELGSTEIEAAKLDALRYVGARLSKFTRSFKEASELPGEEKP